MEDDMRNEDEKEEYHFKKLCVEVKTLNNKKVRINNYIATI